MGQTKEKKEALTPEEIRSNFRILLEVDTAQRQKRGYLFEHLIYSMLANGNLDPKMSYKKSGEQIDGSFFWEGNTYLLEAKWTDDPIPASTIYAFKGKLDGKFHTTTGIFFSAGGYSPDVSDALRFGKTLNIILFNKGDVYLLFSEEVDFLEILKFKLREAGDTGIPLVPYELKRQAKEIEQLMHEEEESTGIYEYDDVDQATRLDNVLLVVEGESDIPVVKNLIAEIGGEISVGYKIATLQGASNIRQLPSLISATMRSSRISAVVVFLDYDQDTVAMRELIVTTIESLAKSSIAVPTEFIFLNHKLKWNAMQGNPNKLPADREFQKLQGFVSRVAQENYDAESEVLMNVLKNKLEELDWSVEDENVSGMDDQHNWPFFLNSLEELINYLDSQVVEAMHEGMSGDWVENHDVLGYDMDVREYLHEHYSDKIKSIGWDTSDL